MVSAMWSSAIWCMLRAVSRSPLRVVEGTVGGAFFGVCAVPQFTHVLCVTVNVVQEGFETIQVFGGGVIFANILVPFVG